MPTITTAEIYERIAQLALVGSDARVSPVIDSGLTIEAIFAHVLRYVVAQKMKMPEAASALQADFTLVFTAGVAPLPGTIDLPDSFFAQMTWVIDGSNSDYDISYLPQRFDHNAMKHRWMVYFWRNGTNVEASFGDGSPFVTFPDVIANAPVIPVISGGNVTASQTVLADVIPLAAAVLRGDFPLTQLI